MKKVFLSLVLFAASMTAFADPSARVVISLNSAYVVARQDATPASYEAFGTPAIVLNVGGTRYSEITTTDIEGLALEYIPTAENFNLEFSGVIGDLYIVNLADNSRTKIENGTFPVTATAAEVAAGAYISNRFALSKLATIPVEFCFRNNELTVNGHAGESLVIASKEGLEIENVASLPATYSKNLSAYNGRYIVTLNSVAYQIDVNPAVTEVVVVP